LIVVDDLAVEPSEAPGRGPHLISNLRSLGVRCGFRLLEEISPAAPAYPLSTARGLAEAGRIGLVRTLFRFERLAAPRWRVSHLEPHQTQAFTGLFQRAFGHDTSEALWEWKYGHGRGQAAVTWQGERLVAHYGGITREILYFGRPERACQVADVMVDPGERGVLTRKGPFFLAGASLPEACSGYGSKHLIGFGFPNERAYRVAERVGLYAAVGRIVELSWPPGAGKGLAREKVEDIQAVPAKLVGGLVHALWRRMATDLVGALIGVRDYAWLQYRYLGHPQHSYRVLHLRGGVIPRSRGIFVLRKEGERMELLDLVAPLKELPALVRAARRIAFQENTKELYTWISEPFAGLLQASECVTRDPGISIPTSIWTPAPPPEALRDRWWLMSGDTDFR
jgi:hypothetical protein